MNIGYYCKTDSAIFGQLICSWCRSRNIGLVSSIDDSGDFETVWCVDCGHETDFYEVWWAVQPPSSKPVIHVDVKV